MIVHTAADGSDSAADKSANWRPIKTAPLDREILIYDRGQIVVARWYWIGAATMGDWRGTYGDGDAVWTPTHWMPLPTPPKSEPLRACDDGSTK
jgi:hypothetical protein